MDVNLRRLPKYKISMAKFLVPLAGVMLHPQLTDHAATQSKQRKDNLQSSKTYTLRTAGISVQITSDALLYLKFLKERAYAFHNRLRKVYISALA